MKKYDIFYKAAAGRYSMRRVDHGVIVLGTYRLVDICCFARFAGVAAAAFSALELESWSDLDRINVI